MPSLSRRLLALVLLFGVPVGLGTARAALAADAVYQWDKLAQVQRIAVAPPWYCVNTTLSPSADDKEQANRQALQTLQATLQQAIPFQLTSRERFRIAPMEVTQRHLRALHWTSADLYIPADSPKTPTWPKPYPERVARLATRLNVDAVLIVAMREPASIAEGVQVHHEIWNVNPLNWSLKHFRAHVVSPTVQAFLIDRSGAIVWKDQQMAYHPRTNPRTSHTLLIDWQEATQQVALQLADSLTRLPPPPGRRQARKTSSAPSRSAAPTLP